MIPLQSAAPSILPLRLESVSFAVQGTPLLHEVSAELRHGARTIVLGHNGAGKSLLLRLCHGLLSPTAGRVHWAGGDAYSARELRRRQAMVFQRPVMLRRSVLANLTYALRLLRMEPRRRRTRAAEALAKFGLQPLAQRPARVLSGGEQQRLTLARAWAAKPEILFLDEPTSSLDPASIHAVEDAVNDFAQSGVKIVMTTHDLGQARRIADDVMFLYRGRLLEHAPADQFFRAPQSPQAAAFLRGELVV